MRNLTRNKYIYVNRKGGINVSLHLRGNNMDLFYTLLRFAKVRHPNVPWAHFIAGGLRAYLEHLPEEDKEIFRNVAKDYYNERYGDPELYIKHIKEVVNDTQIDSGRRS